MTHFNFTIARSLISLLKFRNLLELIDAIDKHKHFGHDAVTNALINQIVLHNRSELKGMALNIVPNTGMGEESFVQWLAYSSFGRVVRAMVMRPQMPFAQYTAMCHGPGFGELAFTGHTRVPKGTPDNELLLKRLACAVLVHLINDYGKAVHVPHFVKGLQVGQNEDILIESMRAFAGCEISSQAFFGPHGVFDEQKFYRDMMLVAGPLIRTSVIGD